MKKVFVVALLLMSFFSVAQIGGEDEVYLNSERIDPTFNGGGLETFYEFINQEFDFSKTTKEGTLVSSFTISETGDIKNIRVIQFVDIESATEIIRVLKKAPKWKPATRNGKAISVDVKLPLRMSGKTQVSSYPTKVYETTTYSDQNKNVIAVKSSTTTKINIDDSENSTPIPYVADLESKPEYPGGLKAFYKFVRKNFTIPEDKKFKGGRIKLSFVVEKDGSLTEIKAESDTEFGIEEEAVRVLKKSKKWTPAKQKGVPVRCSFTLPFVVNGN